MLNALNAWTAVAQTQVEVEPGVSLFWLVIYLALVVVVVAGMWKMFEKANQPGWGALIPIYNIIFFSSRSRVNPSGGLSCCLFRSSASLFLS